MAARPPASFEFRVGFRFPVFGFQFLVSGFWKMFLRILSRGADRRARPKVFFPRLLELYFLTNDHDLSVTREP
jgi:hypothetical protein